ncbi:hypothetical protein EVAR_94021_1 [Eumeta japonica]|uniref:Uncharacterized protein n=1 Tax=Eumeta variegata TaxID=151549 RepID=A0A4C2A8S2_EUMVA|nr:hypothetical protein EVAR_94021_1 [Eumeta japonica]
MNHIVHTFWNNPKDLRKEYFYYRYFINVLLYRTDSAYKTSSRMETGTTIAYGGGSATGPATFGKIIGYIQRRVGREKPQHISVPQHGRTESQTDNHRNFNYK